ncbi:Erum7620/ECH_0207 family putative T1SS effector [Ehrlichia muris]
MQPFIIYKHQKKINTLDSIVFVQDRFSFMAFIFSVFFTLYNKLWLLSFISVSVFTGTYLMYHILNFISFPTYLSINMLYMFYMALSYPDWYQAKLKNMGYRIHDIIFAESLLSAKLKFKR